KSDVPFVRSGRPMLSRLQFEGHTPGIVPKDGGRFTIYGFDLFDGTPPQITLFDASRRKKIAELKAEPAGDKKLSLLYDNRRHLACTRRRNSSTGSEDNAEI